MDQVTVALGQRGRTATAATIRSHTIVMDRPSSIGGADAGLEHLVEVAEHGCLVAATLRQGRSVTASVAAVA